MKILDISSILLNTLLLGYFFPMFYDSIQVLSFLDLIFLFIIGSLSSDLISGTVHWMADRWIPVEYPFIGKVFIKPFHDHHIYPNDITKHNFLETNGNNFFICIPYLLTMLYFENSLTPDMVFYSFVIVIWSNFTNQIHKWSHTPKKELPSIIKLMQKYRIILSPIDHNKHHKKPYLNYYCITNGWLNHIINYINIYKFLDFILIKTFKRNFNNE